MRLSPLSSICSTPKESKTFILIWVKWQDVVRDLCLVSKWRGTPSHSSFLTVFLGHCHLSCCHHLPSCLFSHHPFVHSNVSSVCLLHTALSGWVLLTYVFSKHWLSLASRRCRCRLGRQGPTTKKSSVLAGSSLNINPNNTQQKRWAGFRIVCIWARLQGYLLW